MANTTPSTKVMNNHDLNNSIFSQIILDVDEKNSKQIQRVSLRENKTSITFKSNTYLSTIKSENSCNVTIHIAFVCGGYNSTRNFVTLIKSILFHRTTLLHFHIIVDNISDRILRRLFETWILANLKLSYYHIDQYEAEISWIPNTHYSRKFGLIKLALLDILPSNLSHVIVLDTDTAILSDIAELWNYFHLMQKQNPKALIGLVENQSDWYLGRLSSATSAYYPWPAIGRGFNTGVILLDLEGMRVINWSSKWRLVTETQLISMLATSLADQDIFNTVIRDNPYLVYRLPCEWNVQFSDHSLVESLCNCELDEMKIIHWNSPNKQKLNFYHRDRIQVGPDTWKSLDYFENIYKIFSEYDGELLQREQTFLCDHTRISSIIINGNRHEKNSHDKKYNLDQPNLLEKSKPSNDRCYEFHIASSTTYRTQLFYLEFDYIVKDQFDITLVIQLSMDRIQLLELLCQHWNGPISAALYLTDFEAQQLVRFASESKVLSVRHDIGYHIVYRQQSGVIYPVNKLRNIALEQSTTTFVFLNDVDFVPVIGLYDQLRQILKSMVPNNKNKGLLEKSLLVVPAFESLQYKTDFPTTKADLIKQLNLGTINTFRYQLWPRGHAATNYDKWKTSTLPYTVEWEPEFEPYFVARSDIERYDERFVGFGGNKVSHTMALAARGYKFVVLTNAFIVHMPHAPSLDILRHRSIPSYRRCIRELKESFVDELRQNYSNFFLTQSNNYFHSRTASGYF